jgi:hypothetical protein
MNICRKDILILHVCDNAAYQTDSNVPRAGCSLESGTLEMLPFLCPRDIQIIAIVYNNSRSAEDLSIYLQV